MSVREKLAGLFPGMSITLALNLADEILDEHAHELAEKIRTKADETCPSQMDGMWVAADLLDPDVAP